MPYHLAKSPNTIIFHIFYEKAPRVGLEPTTARLTAACSTDWAIEEYIILQNDVSDTSFIIYDNCYICKIFVPSKLHTDFIPNNRFHFSSFWSSPRPISSSQLHTLLHFHLCPIHLVVFKGSYFFMNGISHLEGGFTLRCLQRLSLPGLATLPCSWHCNRYTSGPSIPVLSY